MLTSFQATRAQLGLGGFSDHLHPIQASLNLEGSVTAVILEVREVLMEMSTVRNGSSSAGCFASQPLVMRSYTQ